MPKIDLITPVEYDPLWPYHHQFDNLPLTHILARQTLINLALDQLINIMEDAEGTAGTVANRLNQSMEDSGALKTVAVDNALHNIGHHTDGDFGGTDYVRMLESERDKLTLISDEATALTIVFDTISGSILFDDEVIAITDSPTVTWNVDSPSTVTANFAFPTSAAHDHFYDLIPIHDNITTPDFINYKSTSTSTVYIDGSLRVYINGIRISETSSVFVYNAAIGPSGVWTLTSFTSDAAAGTFALNRAIDPLDSIIIEFNRNLT